MPVNSQHAEYAEMKGQWRKCCDVYAGQEAIHEAGELYLPKLKEQDNDEYLAYVKRAIFYNATYRTISGLVGMIFRKPPNIELPPSVMDLTEDITMSGVTMQTFAQDVTDEALKVGRVGVLVDYPVVNVDGATQADAARMNLRPFLVNYSALQIINWRTDYINNKTVLSMVVLEECALQQEDEFTHKEVPQWRVLDLDPETFKYRVRIFQRPADVDVLIEGPYFPTMKGAPLDYIPFQFIGTSHVTPNVEEPPMIDLVDLNISHYQTTADLEHGAHFTGLPTPVVSGYKPEKEGEKLYIGSSSAWIFPQLHAKAEYLEFKGEGLKALEARLEVKESQMAVVGARMLEPQKKAVETADTESIHRKGEESMLANVSQTISLGLTTALKWFTDWAGADSTDVMVQMNRDFYPAAMSPQAITALVSAQQQGAISEQTLFENLQRGEIISQDTTFEEEHGRIGDQAAVYAQRQADAAGAVAGAVADAKGTPKEGATSGT